MSSVIGALADCVPKALVEPRKLGGTMTRRACDVLDYVDLAAHQQRTGRGHERPADSDRDYTLICEEPGVAVDAENPNNMVHEVTVPNFDMHIDL